MQQWLLFLATGGQGPDGSQIMDEELLLSTMKDNSYPFEIPEPESPDDVIDWVETGAAMGWFSGFYRGMT